MCESCRQQPYLHHAQQHQRNCWPLWPLARLHLPSQRQGLSDSSTVPLSFLIAVGLRAATSKSADCTASLRNGKRFLCRFLALPMQPRHRIPKARPLTLPLRCKPGHQHASAAHLEAAAFIGTHVAMRMRCMVQALQISCTRIWVERPKLSTVASGNSGGARL